MTTLPKTICVFNAISYQIINGIFCIQFSSVHAQSCLTLCDPMNCSTPGLPVLITRQKNLCLLETTLLYSRMAPCYDLYVCAPSPSHKSYVET